MSDDPWHVPTIQREAEENMRNLKRWIIVETEDGFEVNVWTKDSVYLPSLYPVKEMAAARLLQMLEITHAIVPQRYPERVQIGHIQRSADD